MSWSLIGWALLLLASAVVVSLILAFKSTGDETTSRKDGLTKLKSIDLISKYAVAAAAIIYIIYIINRHWG